MTQENTAKENARTMLKILTDKEYVIFTNRCNDSIRKTLTIAKQTGRDICLFQEEGGWLTYEKYIQQVDLTPVKLITNDGLIFPKELDLYELVNAVLLINSLAGYVALQDMDEINTRCITNDILLINDVSGSIGTPESRIGDIIIGSFGKAKPIDLGEGGFIATNNKELVDVLVQMYGDEEPVLNYALLETKLKGLESRRQLLLDKTISIKQDLKHLPIVHPEAMGLNVIVRFETETEKEELISYCAKHNLEYTLCPREIRILDDAVSIEVKRLTQTMSD